MAHNPVLAVDLGGTKVLACVVDGEGKIVSSVKEKIKGDRAPGKVIKKVVDCSFEALGAAGVDLKEIVGVGVAVPGAVDPERGLVIKAPNLGWKNFYIRRQLEKSFRKPVAIENDVNAGLLGEVKYGKVRTSRSSASLRASERASGAPTVPGLWPGAGASGSRRSAGGAAPRAGGRNESLAAFFVGTGVGGALMINGEIVRGASGSAGEFGHMAIVEGGPKCGCGKRGCLEALASRSAVERELKRSLTSKKLAAALREKDRDVRDALDRAAGYLGVGVANVLNIFNPRVVVLGGGLMEALGGFMFPRVRRSARKHAFGAAFKDCRIELGVLGDYAVVLGVSLFVRHIKGSRTL